MSVLSIPAVDPALEERLRKGLDEVEHGLREATRSEFPLVTEAAQHLTFAGGKRFRPLLVLLAAEFADPSAPGIVPSALVVELTHVATLYHDDVMDEATMRRGAPSANTNWSNSVAILVGDFLFAQASTIVADLGPDAVRLQARTFARLVQGQIRETQGPDDPQSALDHYLRVVADKTGSLISTSALFGARLSGASEPVQVAMRDFGERIGTAFQLADDIIDVASTQDNLGKAPGTDLREGVPTLPALVAMASGDPSDGRLRDLLSRPLTDEADHAEGLALLRAHPAMESSYAYVQREADAARALLVGLPDIPARGALEALCDAVVTRTA
jgi:heptaprenyl diphosphate synthase